MLVVEVDGVHELAVDIELQLVVGAVPEPDGARAAVAVEVIQDLFSRSWRPSIPYMSCSDPSALDLWQRDPSQFMNPLPLL